MYVPTLQLPINGYSKLELLQFRMDMIEHVLDRSEESHKQETEDDEEVTLETKEGSLHNKLTEGESLGAEIFKNPLHMQGDSETELVEPLFSRRKGLASSLLPLEIGHRSPSMSPGYSPLLSTPKSLGTFLGKDEKARSPSLPKSRSSSPHSPTKIVMSTAHEEAATVSAQTSPVAQASPVPHAKSPEKSQSVGGRSNIRSRKHSR